MCSKPDSISDDQPFNQSVQPCVSHRGLERASEAVWFGSAPDDLPSLPLAPVEQRVFASYTGPDDGLATAAAAQSPLKAESGVFKKESVLWMLEKDKGDSAGWARPSRKATGASVTLYDQNPITKRFTGDPVADCFAIVAHDNCGLLGVADGVNWGEKSRLAARTALAASFQHLVAYLRLGDAIGDTRKALQVLLEAFTAAHAAILRCGAGLTTLCLALALPLGRQLACPQFACCCVNLGDSYAFLWSKTRGIREVTIGSHDVWTARDLRNAGGALGPVHSGTEPELHNLTCSLTVCDPGDLLFLTSDGVTDNFDPVVQRIAVPAASDSPTTDVGDARRCQETRPALRPAERHQYSLKQMERALLEHELSTGSLPSAGELCDCLLASARRVTQAKRDILEDPGVHLLDARRPARASRRRDTGLTERISLAPGKLDHATVVAYEVGLFRGDHLEAYEETTTFRPAPDANSWQQVSPSSELADSGCGCSVSDPELPLRASANLLRRHSCSFAPDFLSDIEFADSDAQNDAEN